MAVFQQIKGFEFDRQITIQKSDNPTTNNFNEEVDDWVQAYDQVYAKELVSIGRPSGEVQQADQQVFEQKKAWLITKQDRTITNKMRVVVDSETYNLFEVRAYKSSRELLVLEGVLRK